MISSYKDINHKTEEGKLLLIAIGTIKAYSKLSKKPYINHDDILADLKETEISIDVDLLIRDNF